MVNFRLKLLSYLVGTFVLSSCSTTIGYDGPCPRRPSLEPIDVELQADIPPHTLSIIARNQLKLKKAIKDLEALSGCQLQ